MAKQLDAKTTQPKFPMIQDIRWNPDTGEKAIIYEIHRNSSVDEYKKEEKEPTTNKFHYPMIEDIQGIPDTGKKTMAEELREIHRNSSGVKLLEKLFDEYKKEEY